MSHDKQILALGVMNFFFKKEEGKSLSNFWECEVKIQDPDGEIREYNSGESCFHGEKFIRLGKYCQDIARKHKLLECGGRFARSVCDQSGAVVKKMGRQLILDNAELELWKLLSVGVQLDICLYKYTTYPEVRADLEKSIGKILIHPAMRCSEEKVSTRLWEGKGVVVNGQIKVIGRNMLGNLWMKIREDREYGL